MVATTIALGAIVLMVEIFANRPMVNAISRTENDLKIALRSAERIYADGGSFTPADAEALGAVDADRTYVAADEPADQPGDVSVYASGDTWAASSPTASGTCFSIKQVAGQDTAYLVSDGDCTGTEALRADREPVVAPGVSYRTAEASAGAEASAAAGSEAGGVEVHVSAVAIGGGYARCSSRVQRLLRDHDRVRPSIAQPLTRVGELQTAIAPTRYGRKYGNPSTIRAMLRMKALDQSSLDPVLLHHADPRDELADRRARRPFQEDEVDDPDQAWPQQVSTVPADAEVARSSVDLGERSRHDAEHDPVDQDRREPPTHAHVSHGATVPAES